MAHQEFRGSPGSTFRRIGEAELLEPEVFLYQGFECAAWWQKIVCEPQAVEMKSNGYYVTWGFKGVVEDAYFGALYCGVPIGTYDKSRDVGGEAVYHFLPYAYSAAAWIAEGTSLYGGNIVVALDPDVGVGCSITADRSRTSYHFNVDAVAA